MGGFGKYLANVVLQESRGLDDGSAFASFFHKKQPIEISYDSIKLHDASVYTQTRNSKLNFQLTKQLNSLSRERLKTILFLSVTYIAAVNAGSLHKKSAPF